MALTIEQQRAIAIARARRRRASEAPAEAPAPQHNQPDEAELIAGSPAVRFALGAASLPMGVAQLGAEGLGFSGITENLKRLDEMKRRGATPAADLIRLQKARENMAALPGYEAAVANIDRQIARIQAEGASADPKDAGMDVAGILGATALGGAATRGIPIAKSALGRIAQGVGIGGAAGAATPVVGGDDYWATKGAQTGTGAVLGGLIPGGIELGRGVAGGVRNLADLFTKSGAGRILTRYQGRIIGPKGRQEVIDALNRSREPVPGYQPTVSEAVGKVPAGSPLIAHQKITAETSGGPSAEFGQRILDQRAALKAAEEARGIATAPMREAAVTAANAGGVKSGSVTAGIDKTLGKPGIRASDVVGKTLNAVKAKIAEFTDDAGVIKAEDLYTIRMEIGNTIKTYSKETANWDKRLVSGLERSVQKSIDDAIEAAGGTGWKDYMREFATRSKSMELAKEAVKAAAKPAQRTNLGGGVNVVEESRLHLPQMLSRPMMIANAIMKRVGSGVEPRLDAAATQRYLNPRELAKALEGLSAQEKSEVAAILGRLGAIGGATGAASAMTNTKE